MARTPSLSNVVFRGTGSDRLSTTGWWAPWGMTMPVDATLPYDDANIFARILRGEIPATRLYEDEWAIAFPDIAPQAPTHILVIPKGAYVSWDDFSARASAEEIAGFVRAVGRVARDAGLVEDGYRLLANTGPHSGQEVPHLHVHLFAGRPLGPMLAGGRALDERERD